MARACRTRWVARAAATQRQAMLPSWLQASKCCSRPFEARGWIARQGKKAVAKGTPDAGMPAGSRIPRWTGRWHGSHLRSGDKSDCSDTVPGHGQQCHDGPGSRGGMHKNLAVDEPVEPIWPLQGQPSRATRTRGRSARRARYLNRFDRATLRLPSFAECDPRTAGFGLVRARPP